MSEWLTDAGGAGFAHTYKVMEELYRGRSDFQEIRVIVNQDFGRMLVLDNAVQTTERDEFIYHEMLAHVALLTHPSPRAVLIIGGGDGGLLEETLKHTIERAVMVEIDQEVVNVTRRFLPVIPGRAFDDTRTGLVIGDGIQFLKETHDTFDVVLVDSTDPKGPAVGLFSAPFYRDAARVTGRNGVIAVQSGSPLYQQDLIRSVRANLREAYRHVDTFFATIPTYPGGLWSFTIGSQWVDPRDLNDQSNAVKTREFGLQFYTPEIHRGAFELPPFLARELHIED